MARMCGLKSWLLLTVILDKRFDFPVPQFPNIQNGNNHSIVVKLNELAHVKYLTYGLGLSKCSVVLASIFP